MAPYGEPDWATPGQTATSTTQVAAGTTASVTSASMTNANTGELRARAQWMIAALSFVNVGLSALMAALGVLSLIHFAPGNVNLTAAFLSVYMVIFGVLLFLYELIYWQPFKGLNKTFRKNFGFMYGLKGKGFYLIFMAFLCFGLKDDNYSGVRGLDWATFISWLAVGIVHIFISMTWPEANEAYRPPTGFSSSDPDSVV